MICYSDCLQLMHKFIDTDKLQKAYVQEFPLLIMKEPITKTEIEADENDLYYPYSKGSSSTLHKVYTGERPLSVEDARTINGKFTKTNLIDAVSSLEDDVKETLCEELETLGVYCNTDNVDIVVADLVKNVIKARASGRDGLDDDGVAGLCTEEQASKAYEKKYGMRLILETKGICPNDGCSRPLFYKRNGNTETRYKVVKICPSKPATFDNLLALCPVCAAEYALANQENRTRLTEIKKMLIKTEASLEVLSGTKIEEGIEKVLRKIKDLKPSELIPLAYEPKMVRDKIYEENYMLYLKVHTYVSHYFNKVHDIFKQLSKEGILRFEPFCMQVKLNYINLRDSGLTQPEIFDELVDWLTRTTNEDAEACEVVIAYFVQKCEVFDAITK